MTSPRPAFLLIPAAAAALAFGGCAVGDDGPRTTQTRDVAGFTRIDNEDSVDLRLRVGSPQSIRVRAGAEVIDDVRTEVHDGTLRVTFDSDRWFGDDVIVEATVPELAAIEASGSGDIDVDGLGADAFEVIVDGSADIVARGTVGSLGVELEGSGDADLGELAAGEARVYARGSGDVDVNASDRLDVDVDGSGDVRYHGDPELTRQVGGSGDLENAD